MADVIKEFLVSLGFRVDEGQFRRFQQGITAATESTTALGKEITAVSLALQAGMQRVADQFEGLYYTAQRTGSTISQLQALGFAASNVGTSFDVVKESLATLQRDLRLPGIYQSYIQQITGFRGAITGTDQAQDLLFHHWNANIRQGREFVNEWEASVLHLNYEGLRPYILNIERADEALRRHNERYRELLGPGVMAKLGEDSVRLNNAWRDFTDELGVWATLFTSRFIGPVTEGLEKVIGFMRHFREEFEALGKTSMGEAKQDWLLGIGAIIAAISGWKIAVGSLGFALRGLGLGGAAAGAAGGAARVGVLGLSRIFPLLGVILGAGWLLEHTRGAGGSDTTPGGSGVWDPHKNLAPKAPQFKGPEWWERLKKWVYGKHQAFDPSRSSDTSSSDGPPDEVVPPSGRSRPFRKAAYEAGAGGTVFDDLRDWLHGSTSFVPAVRMTDAMGGDIFNRGADLPGSDNEPAGRPRQRHGDPFGRTISGGDPNVLGQHARGASAENIKTAMDFFTGHGLSQIQAAAMTGRLIAESGLNPLSRGPGGHSGIAQWSRQRQGELFGGEQGLFAAGLTGQLEGIWKEWQGKEAPAFRALKGAQDLKAALGAAEGFERGGLPMFGKNAAEDILGRFGPQVTPVIPHNTRTNNVQHTSNINVYGSQDPTTTVSMLEDLMRRDNGDMVRNMSGAVA